MESIKYMVFSGGSNKVYFYVGALKYIEETYPKGISEVETFVGSSVGAIFSLFCCLGNGWKDVLDTLNQINTSYCSTKICVDQVLSIFDTLGLDNGEILANAMRDVIEKQFDRRDITFRQLKDWLGKNLCVSAFNATKKRTDFFASDTTPDIDVVDAIRASFAIPIIFSPVRLVVEGSSDVYVDGCILDHFPVSYLAERRVKPEEVLGFVIKMNKVDLQEPLELLTFLYSMIDFMFYKINEMDSKTTLYPRVVSFTAEDQDFFIDFDNMRVKSPSKEMIACWIETGFENTKQQFQKYIQQEINKDGHNSHTMLLGGNFGDSDSGERASVQNEKEG